VVAGPNGAGKTSITEQLLRHEWNSVEDASARLLFRAAHGRLVKTYGDINPWAQTIFEVIDRA